MHRSEADSVASLIEHHRSSQPDKEALVDLESSEVLTYQDLARKSAAYAAALFESGIVPGTPVILVMDNSISAILTWCALWRVGAVVCPISFTTMSPAVFQHAIEQLKSTTCILIKSLPNSSLEFLKVLQEAGVRASLLDDILINHKNAFNKAAKAAAAGRALPFDRINLDDDIAAVCFTSGSSGIPKAVVHTHKSYRMNGKDSTYLLGLKDSDRIIEYRPLVWFSAQILSLMPFLQLGMTMHLAQKFSLRRFSNWIDNHSITIAPGGPAILRLLTKRGIQKKCGRLNSLRLMTNSSAPLMPGELADIHRSLGVPILNLYGCSEVGWIAGTRGTSLSGTAGVPLSSVSLRIEKNEMVPESGDMVGQIVVESAKVATVIGAKTTLRNADGVATFYSGDYGKMLSTGEVIVMGRLDDIINKGGIKISPREIEHSITAHPLVNEAFVLGVPDVLHGHNIACFAVLKSGALITGADLEKFLRKHLPSNRIPKYIYFISHLPKTTSGKVDKRKLQQMWGEVNMQKRLTAN